MKNWLKNLFGKKEKKNTELFKEVREGNNVSLYDQKKVEYFESEKTINRITFSDNSKHAVQPRNAKNSVA